MRSGALGTEVECHQTYVVMCEYKFFKKINQPLCTILLILKELTIENCGGEGCESRTMPVFVQRASSAESDRNRQCDFSLSSLLLCHRG